MSDKPARPAVWQRPERGARGPAPERSRPQITAEAVELADAEGLAAVSMRAVAQRLGTGPASLYRYVASRDDLLDLMADTVAGEIDLSVAPTGDWIEDLSGLAVQSKAAYLRHPWMLDLAAQRGPVLGPRAIDYLDHALAVLAPAPGDGRAKLEAIGLVGGLASLFARQELLAASPGSGAAPAPPAQGAYLASVAAEGRHPHLLAALTAAGPPPVDSLADGPVDGPAERDALFRRMLRRVLPGLLA
ncbi:TetR/AcrR family transcriptional regulator [Streptacidiphilus fuscans]|uniref:TetR/AcrR family transcriptional regulator n=1 Tax=Streptacidiphilus fuscans TaxID=2789292 RepID=A0A931B160_9ACTN|nr:TetR/AcrR family transcriptional regulator [Streptacidiphilus fuscans]MBF9068338.1 TetR/AcrR family transcriptional regulator [Streptacidiphilus fuscans]